MIKKWEWSYKVRKFPLVYINTFESTKQLIRDCVWCRLENKLTIIIFDMKRLSFCLWNCFIKQSIRVLSGTPWIIYFDWALQELYTSRFVIFLRVLSLANYHSVFFLFDFLIDYFTFIVPCSFCWWHLFQAKTIFIVCIINFYVMNTFIYIHQINFVKDKNFLFKISMFLLSKFCLHVHKSFLFSYHIRNIWLTFATMLGTLILQNGPWVLFTFLVKRCGETVCEIIGGVFVFCACAVNNTA